MTLNYSQFDFQNN